MNTLNRILLLVVLGGSMLVRAFAQSTEPLSKHLTTSSEEAGFERIFDGQTLKGWEGDTRYWRVENDALVGEVTPQTILKQNTFIIWHGGMTRDFELKVEYRISARGNSGINYRSAAVPDQPFALQGYQADIDGQNRNANQVRYTGQNYEERGRTFLALRGQTVRLVTGEKPLIIASLGDPKALEAFIKNDDWNELHLIARQRVVTYSEWPRHEHSFRRRCKEPAP